LEVIGNGLIIQTKSLGKVFYNGSIVRVLESIDLTVKQGEFLAITGPSGSGKSTLLHLIGALDQPTTGEIWVDGMNVGFLKGNALADFRRAKIGFVFQLFNLIPSLTAIENVKLPLLPYKRDLGFNLEDRSHELLKMLGLESRYQHFPGQLSGGEQQRVAIARALINHPRLILADEPTGNLDSRSGADILHLLSSLNKDMDISVLVVTHDIRIASQASRRIALLDGRLYN
jgi:ABC-type lipoprotein export system ATPase subunit